MEYTQLAEYGGDILVEHDVTFDLFTQIARRERTLSAAWDAFRWRRFERRTLRRLPRVVVMSPKDAEMVGVPATVIPNGVDLDRFRAAPETPGERLLFIGSFRHFPNIAAYRFFTEEVWPLLRDKFPNMSLTVVSGDDYLTYWRAFADSPEPAPDPRIRLLGFVSDVRPLYAEANLVLVPTTVSAGTNVKVLEAMAMERAVISTSSGCAGLGLLHGHSVWVADSAVAFAAAVATLINDSERRRQMALPPTESPCATSIGLPLAKSSEPCFKPNSLPQNDPSRRDAVLDFHLLGGLPSALFDHDRISPQSERDRRRCDLIDALAVHRNRRTVRNAGQHQRAAGRRKRERRQFQGSRAHREIAPYDLISGHGKHHCVPALYGGQRTRCRTRHRRITVKRRRGSSRTAREHHFLRCGYAHRRRASLDFWKLRLRCAGLHRLRFGLGGRKRLPHRL